MARTLDAENALELDTALPVRRGVAPRLIGLVTEGNLALAVARTALVAPSAPNLLECVSERLESTPGCMIVDAAVPATLRFNVPGSGGTITDVEHTFTRLYPGAGLISVRTGSMQPNASKSFTVTLPQSGLWLWEARARRGSLFSANVRSTDATAAQGGVGFALLAWLAPVSNPQPF